MDKLLEEYKRSLSQLIFDEADLDYTLLERLHKPTLTLLAKVSNSVITVFDMYAKRHIFVTNNLFELFGTGVDIEEMDKKIHPDDVRFLLQQAISTFKYLFSHKMNMSDYKFIIEYRMCNETGEYLRVIEQQSCLQPDKAGNAWLILSVLDLSPDQSSFKSVKSTILKKSDNTFLPIQNLYESHKAGLSQREIDVLQMVKEGLLSKEISEQLCISVHTVNTHRQRILEKLDADNSIEAINNASALGLLNGRSEKRES